MTKLERKQLEAKANNGDIASMLELGKFYIAGKCDDWDLQKAVMWYTMAADKGDSDAMFELGDIYKRGWDVEKDLPEAIKWYKLAADKGNIASMLELGRIYEGGRNLRSHEKDIPEAIKWYKMAADKGDATAMDRLGGIYEDGWYKDDWVVEKDFPEAFKWLKMAADKGNSWAISALGHLGEHEDFRQEIIKYLKMLADKGDSEAISSLQHIGDVSGQRYSQDIIEYFKMLAEKGNSEAMNYLGIIYERGWSPGFLHDFRDQDFPEAIKWFKMAAERGNSEAFNFLRTISDNQKSYSQDIIEYIKMHADKGNSAAMDQLGFMYKYGSSVVSRDTLEAIKWYKMLAEKCDSEAIEVLQGYCDYLDYYEDIVKLFKKLAAQGNSDAMYQLGKTYQEGESVEEDYRAAIKWHKKAAAKGDIKAMLAIGDIYKRGWLDIEQNSKTLEYIPEAIKWYKMAADMGDTNALVELGRIYSEGEGVSQDIPEAIKWYKLDIFKNYSRAAMYELGRIYQKGKGISQDIPEAIKLFTIASGENYDPAWKELKILLKKKALAEGSNIKSEQAGSDDKLPARLILELSGTEFEREYGSFETDEESVEGYLRYENKASYTHYYNLDSLESIKKALACINPAGEIIEKNPDEEEFNESSGYGSEGFACGDGVEIPEGAEFSGDGNTEVESFEVESASLFWEFKDGERVDFLGNPDIYAALLKKVEDSPKTEKKSKKQAPK